MEHDLSTYLHDHLAGAQFAIDMLERLRDAYPEQPISQFAERLRADIEEDRAELRRFAESIGEQGVVKEAAAWVAEKLSRLKLRLGAEADLAVFESLEALSLGILGKRALWRALETIADFEPRISQLDLARLIARAEAQHAAVEAARLKAARTALRPREDAKEE